MTPISRKGSIRNTSDHEDTVYDNELILGEIN